MRFNKKGYSLIYVIIWMVLAWIVLSYFITYYKNVIYTNSEIESLQDEFNLINNGLTSIQKIIFEKWLYFTFTDWIFWFKVLENNVEVEYLVDEKDCGNWLKTIFYTDGINQISLLWNKCLNIKNIELNFPNNEIKEQIFRLKITTDNSQYFTTLFVR